MTLDEKIAYAKNPSHEEIQENQDIEAAKALTADELKDRIKTLHSERDEYEEEYAMAEWTYMHNVLTRALKDVEKGLVITDDDLSI